MKKSHQLVLALCGTSALAHCGGELDVGETGAGAPAAAVTPPEAGAGGDSSASGGRGGGTAGSGGNRAGSGGKSSAGGTGNVSGGLAGEGATTNSTSGGSGPGITAGAGNDGGQAGTGGGAGAQNLPCECGSTTTLSVIDCQEDVTYGANVSDDGSVVQFLWSSTVNGENHSALWTAAQGTIFRTKRLIQGLSADGKTSLFVGSTGVLHTLDGKETAVPLAQPDFLSRDGRTVVGRDGSGAPLIWTAADGVAPVDLGAGATGMVYALSADASVLGGWVVDSAGSLPFVKNASGLHHVVQAAGHSSDGIVYAISDNGLVAAGTVPTGEMLNYPQSNSLMLFSWSETGGTASLGLCRIADHHGACDGGVFISADGSVLAAGVATSAGSTLGHAVRFTQDGPQDLDPDEFATVSGISRDGNVVLGHLLDGELFNDSDQPGTPFLWTPSLGKKNLAERLESAGADLSGWTFGPGTVLSRDGNVVVGNGTCNGVPALYRAYLPR